MPISRAQFFGLTKLNVDSHTGLKRRDLLPVPNAADRTYTPFEAYAYLIAERLVESDGLGMNWHKARDIVRDCLRGIIVHAEEIEGSGSEYRKSDDHQSTIFVGRLSFVMGRTEPFVGTSADLGAFLAIEDVVDVMLTSATAGYAVLLSRARNEGVDLSEMWPEVDSFPSFAERRELSLAPLREAVDRANARRSSEA